MEKIKEPGDENVSANLHVPAHPTDMFLDDKRDSDDVKNIQLLDVQYISPYKGRTRISQKFQSTKRFV
jgi:hypothetical protein